MTNKEAIEHIKDFLNGDQYDEVTKEHLEAMEYAIKALEETDIDWQSEMAKDYGVREAENN